MADLKRVRQDETGRTTGKTPPGSNPDEENQGAEFGASERATRGTNRDADESGESKNEGHGHPREERKGTGG